MSKDIEKIASRPPGQFGDFCVIATVVIQEQGTTRAIWTPGGELLATKSPQPGPGSFAEEFIKDCQ